MSDEEIDKEFEKLESEVKQDQQEAENIEKDVKNKEEQVESEEQSSGAEIQDAEQKGDQRELVDAEEKTEEEIQEEEQVEEEIEQAEKDIMEEINLEEKQEQLLEKMQKDTKSELKDALNKLKKEKKLLTAKNSENTQIQPTDYENIEEVLNEFRDAAGNVHRFTRELEEILQEISRTEDEENYLENLTSRLPQELDFMENEVKELLTDFQKLQDSKHGKMAQKEGQQLKQLEKEEQKIEQMEQKIDKELQNELQEAENLVREDKQMIKIIDQSISELEELYEILEQEKSIWRFALNQNPPIDDVRNTIEILKKVISEDESELQKAGDFASKLMQKAPKGPSANTVAGVTATGGKITAKASLYLLIGFIALVIILTINAELPF